MFKRVLLSIWILVIGFVSGYAQTVVIGPTTNNGGFEDATNTAWQIVNGTETNRWVISTGATAGFTGSKCAYITDNSSSPFAHNYVTSGGASTVHLYQDVTFPAALPVVNLSFKLINYGENGWDKVAVYISNGTPSGTPAAGTPAPGYIANNMPPISGYTELGGYALNSSWTNVNIAITQAQAGNATASSQRRILFVWTNDASVGTQPPGGIDDVLLTAACSGPIGLNASAITTNSATLNWTALTGATGYNVRYKKVSDPVTVATWATPTTVAAGVTSLPITGLTALSTQYEFQVSANGPVCNNYNASAIFVTVCGYATLPYSETFESSTGATNLPGCMAATSTAAYSGVQILSSPSSSPAGGANHTPGGSKYAAFYYSYTNSIFTPAIDVQAGKMYQVSFWYQNTAGNTSFDSLVVGYGGSQTPAGMTNNIAKIVQPAVATGTYTQYVTNFVATANATVYFGFKVASSNYNSYSYFSLDDIGIIELPPCTGKPVAGTIVSTPTLPCLNKTSKLSLNGSSQQSGLAFQWQQYNYGTATWANIGGATTNNYTTPTLLDSVRYRTIVTCTNPGGSADTTAAFNINPYTITLPYTETFESITANNQLPNCWDASDMGTRDFTYISVPSYPAGGLNHTPGGSKFAAFNGSYYPYQGSWFYTPGVKLDTGKTYQVKFWYVTSSSYTWSLLRLAYGNGQTPGAMTNTVYTKTGVNNGTYQQAKVKFSVPASGVYNLGLNGDAGGYAYSFLSFDDFNMIELPACSGKPLIVMGQADTLNICPDTTASALLSGTAGDFSGMTYQWDSSTNGTAWFPITGANQEEYLAYASAIYPKVYYRLRVTCVNGGLSDTGRVVLNVKQPAYAALPYFNGFETWVNSCATTDVPSGGNWKQYWYTGNASWRRNDQGASANWTSPTTYNYSPAAQSGSYSARFHGSYALGFSPPLGYGEGHLDMYLNCSANTGSKGLYFYYINAPSYKSDSLTVWYSVDGGLVFTQADGWEENTITGWSRRIVNIPSNSPATIVSFRARKHGSYDYSDIGIDSVYVANPCTGTPTAGNIALTGSATVCAGSSVVLNLTGTSMAGGITVQWEASTTSGTTGFASISTPGSVYGFTTPAVTANTWYRARVACAGSGLFNYSNVIAVTTTPAVYATLPYVENFESWTTRCNTNDIPSTNWTNAPATGNNSWRRHDQGANASWTSAVSGAFFPASAIGNYAARFHNYYATDGAKGRMDLYVNCSGTGNKELRYYINMSNRSTYLPIDYTRVSYSTDGGVTFSNLTTITSTTGWEQKVHVVPSTSATTLIRFEASADQYVQDIGLDYIEVLPACTGTPVAGIIDSVRPCSGSSFQLKASGTSLVGGLTYQWQSTTAATPTGFANVLPAASGTNAAYTTAITQPTWYRLIVSCSGGNASDTTAPFRAELGSFFNCYCSALPYYPYTFNTTLNVNIGNVTLKTQPANTTILNNGVATPLVNNTTSTNPNNPGYTSFTNLPVTPVYLDSVYQLSVQQVSSGTSNAYASTVSAWVDFNQDGTFDPVAEKVVMGTVATTNRQANLNFTVPPTAKVGVTAMRVILSSVTNPSPCGIYNYYGETEDYLLEVRYHPCGFVAVNAGTAVASDLNTCAGYKVTLTDTSYEKKQYGLVRQWQQSTNGGASFTNISGSQNRDTFKALVNGPTLFRFALTCSSNNVVSYSNVLDVKMNEPYQCYCASYADGGTGEKADSSDVGSFSIGNYTFQVGGPHLQNPVSVRERTDYTESASNVVELIADSTYKIDVYHIMRGRVHKDAKVTLFMDFNNDFQYSTSPAGSNYPSERVLTAFTSAQEYYLDNMTITIPKGYVIPNVLTGMRLILNENVGASNASDEGCGVYTSGETEDFAVIFRDGSAPQGVGGSLTNNVKVLSLYPNPTSGVATVSYTSDVVVKELELTITNTTGQVISKKVYKAPGKSFTTDVDLSGVARGVYFVELKADGERIVRKLVTQ